MNLLQGRFDSLKSKLFPPRNHGQSNNVPTTFPSMVTQRRTVREDENIAIIFSQKGVTMRPVTPENSLTQPSPAFISPLPKSCAQRFPRQFTSARDRFHCAVWSTVSGSSPHFEPQSRSIIAS
ncbi:hypothetical protein Aduo_004844 [Ancylostoma duodenale]